MSAILESPEHVLPTLERDGSRRWLNPRPSQGPYFRARRLTAVLLIALFVLLPHWKVGGKQALLFDCLTGQLSLFGITFLPTDTALLALFLLSTFLSVFLATALLGRVWCGWGCPQTVYMEFVYRPLERFFDGPGSGRIRWWGARKVAKYSSYLVISALLAHTFLAYFVGVDRLKTWLTHSPVEHVGPFCVMAFTTGLMMFDFCFFREQLCLVACPYGRFQSALLDRGSLIVAYDKRRGEPRGKLRVLDSGEPTRSGGDCIDCGLCVRTCPTGIDIRDGLQMECIHCTQCMDACDEIMDRIHAPRGLVRYASQNEIDGKPRGKLRPRPVIYSILLTISVSALATLIVTRSPVDVTVLRGQGMPFLVTPEGNVQNGLRIKVVSRVDGPRLLSMTIEDVNGPVDCDTRGKTFELFPGESLTVPVLVTVPRSRIQFGQAKADVVVTDTTGWERRFPCRLLGP